jgi:hypothetical protein
MPDHSTVGVYETLAQAEEAVRKLDQGRFPITQVSVIAQNLETDKEVHGFITAGDVARQGAGTGAWFGGIFGLLMGGAFLFVPGFGPVVVAGSLAAMMLGGVEGAAFGAAGGGVLGALVGWGVSKEHVVKYEDHVKGGKYLVVAHGNAEEVSRAHDILRGSSVSELDRYADGSTGATATGAAAALAR